MQFDLTDFHNRLFDGLTFCKRVYALLSHIRREQNGLVRLRLRQEPTSKRLVEELIPIARYVQSKYSQAHSLKVRWVNGNQTYDARLLFSGPMVENGLVPREAFVEVTTVVHKHDYILRRILNERGYAFGPKGIIVDARKKTVEPHPYACQEYEFQEDLAARIIRRITAKEEKGYPAGTILILQCFLDTFFEQHQWDYVIRAIGDSPVKHRFRELYICDSNARYVSTIYSN